VKSFFDFLDERCWPGYKSVRGKKAYSPGSCVKEDLRNWFNPNHPDGNWKRVNTKGEVVGDCAREPGEPKPKCMSQSQRDSLSKKEKASAVRRKRKEDPNAERRGKPINVTSKVNENMEQLDEKNKPTNPELWSRAISQAKSKFDVYPSAYANGWASKWYKEHGGGWKTVSENSETKSSLKTFKQISEIVMPQVKDDLNSLDKTAFTKKHGLSKTDAKAKITQEAKEKTEYDYEGDMARGQLQSIISNAQRVHDMLEDDTNIAEWVQSKITLAEDYISTVANYMMSEIDESTSASVRMQRALQKAKEQRERGERAGAALLKPKPPVQKEEVELDEVSLGNYKEKATQQVKDLKPHTKGEYSDIAKRAIERRQKGIKMALNREETEQIEEGRASQRHPLEGHEYHKKSDEALIHIAKDAHAAAEAMKSHNTDAENKYRDQANDSATVRHYRKTNGMPEWYKKKYGHMKESFKPMDEPNYKNSIQARQKKADDDSIPFDGPYRKRTDVVTDKSGAKHGPMSIARNLAKQAMKKQASKMSVKEETEQVSEKNKTCGKR